MLVRLVVTLVIALLCATPVGACTADEPDAPCLIDELIVTDAPAATPAPSATTPRLHRAHAAPAADPGRARVFRPPRA